MICILLPGVVPIQVLKMWLVNNAQMKFKKSKQEDQIVAPPAFIAYKERVLAAYTSKVGKEKANSMVQIVLAKAQATGQVIHSCLAQFPRLCL